MSNVNMMLGETLPNEFMPTQPVSTSNFVVSRRMREYTSDSQTSFSFNGTDTIRFILNSPDSFLDGRNSWLQFKLYGAFTGAAPWGGINNIEPERLGRFLSVGGGHALFRRLRISLSNGTIISDHDYSSLYSIIRQYTMSENHLQYNESMQSFDGLHSNISTLTNNGDIILNPFTLAQSAAATLGALGAGVQVLTIAGCEANLRIGDLVEIYVNNDQNDVPPVVTGKVVAVPTAGTASLDTQRDYGAIVAGNIREVRIIRKGERSSRYRGAQGTADGDNTSVLVKIKLLSDFLNNVKYIPMPFLRNLQIELTLNRDAHTVVFAKPATGTPDFRWTIKDPVFVANLITPSEKLMSLFVEEYNTENGIVMQWVDYQSNTKTLQNTAAESVVIPSNCHSALGILAVQKLPESESVNADSWVVDTQGVLTKNRVDTYQFQIGSEYYPFGAPAKCHSVHNGNAFSYVLQSLDSHGAKYESTSIIPQEFYAVNTIVRPTGGNVADESLRFVMAQRFDRDGNYTGVDCTNNDIQLNIVRSGVGTAGTYLHTFVICNKLIRISRSSTIVYQ